MEPLDLPFDLDAEVVRLIKARLIELPTYPGVALQLQRLIASETYSLDALVRLVEADPALATHVIRAANSAFFRATTPITTLPAAISRVGASELANIAIAGTLGLQASIEGPLAEMRRDSWRRSLVGALLSQELARVRTLDAGEAFLAGLLHDFGETIAYRTFEVVLQLHPRCRPQHAAQWQWQAQRYHVELGMALAADWRLPALLQEVVMRHHDDDTAFCEHPELVELVALTDDLSTHLFEAPSLEAAELPARIGLSTPERQALQRLVPRLPSLLQSLELPSEQQPVQSLVAPAAPVVPPSAPRLDLEVAVVKKDVRDGYRLLQATDAALRMKGSVPQTERRLVTLEVQALSFSATVVSCTAADDGCVIELKPFALSGEQLAQWRRLVRDAERAKAA
ncbi:MAG: HDOD domain-containing protein [Myxococcaceae bacterium]|nr:HDOD domain-containing protein [Myxococcaceae bacterium]